MRHYWLLLLFLTACQTYKQNIMVRTDSSRLPKNVVQAAAGMEKLERNYVIRKDDILEVVLYSNKGENMIDFNIPKPGAIVGANGQGGQSVIPRFLVEADGNVRLPQVGAIRMEGYTIRQADSLLAVAYNKFYVDPFVVVKCMNKRVIVLGATENKVVPLTNENMNIFEVLALCGGIHDNGKAHNIRLIRGNLADPEVYLLDLSTIEGMTKANLAVKPNDIIYVEPVKRTLRESVADISPILSLLSGIVTIVSFVYILRNPSR